MIQTLENIAGIRLRTSADHLDSAASVLREIGGAIYVIHATQLEGAARMAREWAIELDKAHDRLTGEEL